VKCIELVHTHTLPHAAKEIAELWHEYEAGTTAEALFVKGKVCPGIPGFESNLSGAGMLPVVWVCFMPMQQVIKERVVFRNI
jgi:hypothetical protein